MIKLVTIILHIINTYKKIITPMRATYIHIRKVLRIIRNLK